MAIGPAQYDFSINTPDVLAEFQKGQNYGQQQALLMQQRQIAQAQAAQQQEMANRVFGIQAKVQNGTATAEDYAQLQTLDPKNSEGYKRAFETMDTGRKSSMFESQVPVYTALQNKRVDVAKNLITQQIDALKNSVQTPETMRRLQGAQTALSLIDSGPDGAVQAQMLLGSALQGLDPERFGKIVTNQSAANADQRAQELQGGLVRKGLAEAVQQEAKASTAYKMAQTELVKAGWDIENLKSLIQDRKEGQKVALLNAQIAREGNSIKREELKLKRDEIQDKQATKLRETAAEVASTRGNIDNLLNTVDRIKKHPKTDSVLGSIAGKQETFITDSAADAASLIDTLGSQVFLAQVPQLKGTGALSEQEGNKLQASLQSLKRTQSPEQFRQNLDEVQRLMIKARKNVSTKYGVPDTVPDTPAALPTAGQLRNFITKHGGPAMATIQQIEKALKNAIAAGAMDDARQLQAALNAAKQDASNQIPGADVSGSLAPAPRPSLGQRIKGAGEATLTFGTGIPSSIGGGLAGLAAVPVEVAQKLSGSQSPVDAEKVAQNVTQAFTYAPRTEAGREYVQDIASNLEGLQALPGIQGELGAVANVAKMGTPYVAGVTRPLTAPVAAVGQKAGQAVSNAYQTVKGAVTGAPKKESFGPGSIGAAQTPQAVQRRATAEALGFTDEAALTEGQATRDFGQLQFEKEAAKQGEVGAPLRQRQENQTKKLLGKFDELVDQPGPVNVSERAIGQSVDQALVNKANLAKGQIRAAYEKAKNAGELAEPVPTNTLVQVLNESTSAEGTAPVLSAARRELIRLGGATADENGNLIPKELPVNDLEELRKFVNSATKQEGPDLKYSGDLKRAIDTATEAAGGDFYKKARKLRADYAREFENTALTEQLLSQKRGTSQRQVAFEDVFKKVILDSPIEEMNKLRRTLLTAGPEGKQAWTDLKAKGIEHIKEGSLNTGMTEGGNPLVSPAKLGRVIKELDREGKLESLYGKKQAQQIRDLGDIATVIYTAPPGSVNFSNTASALQVALDGVATGAFVGLPLPVITALKEGAKYVKNAKTRTRIKQALGQAQAK